MFYLKPCYYSSGEKGGYAFGLIGRLLRDIFTLLRNRSGASGLHIFGQYRTAIYREFVLLLVSQILFLPVLYQIRAGEFINWYKRSSRISKFMASYVLKNSRIVLCEGKPYVTFLKKSMNLDSMYFPNYVIKNEIPEKIPKRLTGEVINVIYTGTVTEDKGVWDTVLACNAAVEAGIKIKLTLAGKEAPAMTERLDNIAEKYPDFELVRMGSIDRSEIMMLLKKSDVFCMPSRYTGEGHSNAINEAMMWGLVIISTRHGFLETVLGEDGAYLLEHGGKEEISDTLSYIHVNRENARDKAKYARQCLINLYSSDSAFKKLDDAYYKLVHDKD
jgi:glycosyltransferase involved in cell wall biosynthesis